MHNKTITLGQPFKYYTTKTHFLPFKSISYLYAILIMADKAFKNKHAFTLQNFKIHLLTVTMV